VESLHEVRFPGESDEYRRARDELLRAETELRRQTESVAAARRRLPLGGEVPLDYVFQEWDPVAGGPREVRLSELFDGEKDTLFLYSFMFIPDGSRDPLGQACPSCTSIIDAVDGEVPHITQRVSFAVSAKVPVERIRAHAQSRGWRHARLLSSAESTYNVDYGAEAPDGEQWPLATVFVRRDGRIHHHWSSELFFLGGGAGQDPRHVDFMWPVWAVLNTTPDGRGSLHLSLSYD
jgi:predicted dithiol-disulfide oxidoreductase (DUF899 family)